MQLSNRTYDILKALDLVWIPALTTFYVTLDSIFGWGYGDTVAKGSAAVCTLLGALLGISSATYYQQTSPEIPEGETEVDHTHEGMG